jgi:hypothetical protein
MNKDDFKEMVLEQMAETCLKLARVLYNQGNLEEAIEQTEIARSALFQLATLRLCRELSEGAFK